jgi:hypothetical protein
MEEFTTDCNNGVEIPAIISFAKFLNTIGRSRTTGWRWRQHGWINVVIIAGRPYVRREDIKKFLARAERGEFANDQRAAIVFGDPASPQTLR